MSQRLTDVSVAELNDRLAREHSIDDYYARSPSIIRFIEQKRLEIIQEMVGEVDGRELAEIGSGGGHVLRMFPKAKITAIDVSDIFLDTAKKNLVGYDAKFIKGEVDKLDLPAASFDRIICTEVLEHTLDPEAILRAISRLLRPAGIAVITVPNDPLILQLKGLVRRTPVGWVLRDRLDWGGDMYHLHKWKPSEFQRILERHFRITERSSAPHDLLPIRACFRCAHK
ncbi:MAG TPA: class I SAM-dependent methyltransferase [Polyangium sp.]|nr:class I SAM-dependent methyltransferase [Polyangium sp.]